MNSLGVADIPKSFSPPERRNDPEGGPGREKKQEKPAEEGEGYVGSKPKDSPAFYNQLAYSWPSLVDVSLEKMPGELDLFLIP